MKGFKAVFILNLTNIKDVKNFFKELFVTIKVLWQKKNPWSQAQEQTLT